MHKSIQIKHLTLFYSQKLCFNDFNTQVFYGNRIAIIGRNGCGKTSLLKLLMGSIEPSNGVIMKEDAVIRFVPQIIEEFNDQSGGERFNLALTKALVDNPNVLLLDEPTNHLDRHNRKSLTRMLESFKGTLIIASHDTELLRNCIDTLWHIEDDQVFVFNGAYDDYMHQRNQTRTSIEQKVSRLNKQKKAKHADLMNEQKRAAKSKTKGVKSITNRKWPTIVSTAKAGRAQETSGRKQSTISIKKQNLIDELSSLRRPEVILPKFSLKSRSISNQSVLTVSDGVISLFEKEPILKEINISIYSRDRVSIQGVNASGKTTFIKAIMGFSEIVKSGSWHLPYITDIGYLDQHYSNLSPLNTVLETISELMPSWSHLDVRRHLNDFLFRKNEEVHAVVTTLSGGEKARLSLAKIAALTPKILILDEITNNLDIETKEHVVEVLKAFPGTMIVISHDIDFLRTIGVNRLFEINNNTLCERKELF